MAEQFINRDLERVRDLRQQVRRRMRRLALVVRDDTLGHAEQDPDGVGVVTTVNLRYPGQYFDVETGLHYNWHRYYDPTIGRYMTSDPISIAEHATNIVSTQGKLGSIRAELNSYSYVSNNPLRHIDPTGLDATVTLYSGASGFGHVGIGVNSPNTTGFYPSPGASTWDVITGQPVPGVMQPDTRTLTQTITIPATAAQDRAIQDYITVTLASPTLATTI